jgi:hypothetical protein
MFHVILFILKIFGIILLSILGLLIFLILIVLFVPIRYKIEAEKKDKILASANVSWLFRLLYCQITFIENKFRMRLRLLGKVIIDSDKPKERVKRGVKRFSKRIEKKVTKRVEEEVEEQADKQTEGLTDVQPEVKTRSEIEETAGEQVESNTENYINLKKSDETKKIAKDIMQEDTIYHDNASQDFIKSGKKQQKRRISIFCKVKNIFKAIINKIKEFLDKIINIFIKIKDSFLNLKNKLIGIQAIWQKCRDFLQNETNREAIKHIFKSLRKMFRHIRPFKVRIQMEFGTGDPCQTGQALGAAALLYGYYGEAIKITPNFETEIFEGTLFVKGRIRLFTLLIICIKLLLDKNFRQFIKNSKALKEDL